MEGGRRGDTFFGLGGSWVELLGYQEWFGRSLLGATFHDL